MARVTSYRIHLSYPLLVPLYPLRSALLVPVPSALCPTRTRTLYPYPYEDFSFFYLKLLRLRLAYFISVAV
jgi:hypothetical protein